MAYILHSGVRGVVFLEKAKLLINESVYMNFCFRKWNLSGPCVTARPVGARRGCRCTNCWRRPRGCRVLVRRYCFRCSVFFPEAHSRVGRNRSMTICIGKCAENNDSQVTQSQKYIIGPSLCNVILAGIRILGLSAQL